MRTIAFVVVILCALGATMSVAQYIGGQSGLSNLKGGASGGGGGGGGGCVGAADFSDGCAIAVFGH